MLTFPGKIPIRIHPFFWLLTGMIGWLNSETIPGTLIWMAVMLISVLVHEFGHALTAVMFGQTAQIELMVFGGVTQRSGDKLKLWQEFTIVMNGPLAGLALCLVSFLFFWSMGGQLVMVRQVLAISFTVNLIWTLLNLIPVQPLDGGKLLSIILEAIFGFKGIKIGYFFSIGLSLMIGIYFFSLHDYFPGSLFLLFAFENYRMWKTALTMTDQDQNKGLQQVLQAAEDELKEGHDDSALMMLADLRKAAKSGLIYVISTQYIARIMEKRQEYQQAYDLLHTVKGQLSIEGVELLQFAAYKLQKWKEAISYGVKVYRSQPSSEVAVINAFCHAMIGEVKPAIGWLQSAITDGLANICEVLQRSEFDLIRNDPLFQTFMSEHA